MLINGCLTTTVIFPGSSERYIDGIVVIFAANANLPIINSPFWDRRSPIEMQTFFISANTEAIFAAFAPPGAYWRLSRHPPAQVADVWVVLTKTMPAFIPTRRATLLLTSRPDIRARPDSTSFAKRNPSASSLNGSSMAHSPKDLFPPARRIRRHIISARLGAGSYRSDAQAGSGFSRTARQQRCALQCRGEYSQRPFSQCCY